MGQYFQPTLTGMPASQQSDWVNSPLFQQLMGMQAPQVQAPRTPATNQGLSDIQQNVQQFGPQLGQFFSQMMQGGGMPQMDQLLDQQSQLYQGNVDQIKANAGTMPLGSARDRYFGQGMGQAASQHNLANQQALLQQQNIATQNRFSGAQGLAGMPNYYGAPGNLEMQLLQLLAPYDLANQQSQINMSGIQAGLMSPLLQQTPIDYVERPSGFEQDIAPVIDILGLIMQMAAAGVPLAV